MERAVGKYSTRCGSTPKCTLANLRFNEMTPLIFFSYPSLSPSPLLSSPLFLFCLSRKNKISWLQIKHLSERVDLLLSFSGNLCTICLLSQRLWDPVLEVFGEALSTLMAIAALRQ